MHDRPTAHLPLPLVRGTGSIPYASPTPPARSR
jgi:hypothetical protein